MARLSATQFCSWISKETPLALQHALFSGVAVDSRHVEKGHLFFALPGAKTDGHQFLQDVQKKGAIAAVVRRDFVADNTIHIPLIRVDNPLETLQQAARQCVKSLDATHIAITGSLGKTTTKEFVYTLLRGKYKVAATSGNKNSQIGLALALLNEVKGDEEYLVLEMGMTAAGQITQLASIAPPDIALITSIALVHAEFFDGIQDIAQAKSEIFLHPRTKLGIVNSDTNSRDLLLQAGTCPKRTFSAHNSTSDYELLAFENELIIREYDQSYNLGKIQLPAKHFYENLLGAISVARAASMSFEEIKQRLPYLVLPSKRLEEVTKQGITFINDAYNAAELSMKGALESVAKRKNPGRKIAVLGHMRELGKFSNGCHQRVGEYAINCVDHLFCIGEECGPLVDVWKAAKRDVIWCQNFEELMKTLSTTLRKGDLVLIKGARSLQLERILEQF